MKPKISVIVPVFNTEKYVDKCIASIRNQTLKNIEIICVNDCSPDNSYLILERHAKEDSRIILINHKINMGLGGARNTGIKHATADFIASVDSDDTVQLEMLEVLWCASKEGVFDITCCGYRRVNGKGQEITKTQFQAREVHNIENNVNIFTLVNPAFWNKLWRKSLFIDNEIYFPNHLFFQDMATTPLLITKAKRIKMIDSCLYNYLVRDGSVTTSYSPKHIIDYFKVYEILYDYLYQHDLSLRYSKELISYINEGMRFHSNNIYQSDLNVDDKKQYLRHLLMMKWSFFESFDALSTKKEEELMLLLTKSLCAKDIRDNKSTLFGVDFKLHFKDFNSNFIKSIVFFIKAKIVKRR